MSHDSRQRLWRRLALATGVLLLCAAARSTDWTFVRAHTSSLLPSALAAIAISGAWHVTRTWAWGLCFPTKTIPWSSLVRVRLAAEAVSYVTVRGVVGEPLKVVFLRGRVDAARATAAVALERVAYLVFTTILVGVGAGLVSLTLPLTSGWRLVFRVFAIGSAVLVTALLAVVLRRGRGGRSATRAHAAAPSPGRARVFLRSVGVQLDGLLREHPRRMLALAAASLAGYLLMALEAWVVLRIGGWPIGFGQALAIETLTRVMSMATAVIPANLGALEVASLAATAAVGAPGGALLAVARRLRGLFWAAAGFAVFPPGPRHGTPAMARTSPSADGVLLYVAVDPRTEVLPSVRIAGLPLGERVVRAAVKAGYHQVVVWAPGAELDWVPCRQVVTVVRTAEAWRRQLAGVPDHEAVTAIGPATLVSPALLRDAAQVRPADARITDVSAGPGFPMSGVLRLPVASVRDVEGLASALVERVWHPQPCPPGELVSMNGARLSLRVPTGVALPAADATLQRSVFKSTDATVARFNRRVSLPISIALLPTPVTANAMSIFVWGLGLIAGWMFSLGEYGAGLVGASLSLGASILDGCDGEIARLKYQESPLGCWLETLGDYSYYVAIFLGLTIGAMRQTGWAIMGTLGAAGLAGTLLSFALLIYLRRTITDGRPETLHAVARSRFKAEPSWWSGLVWRVSFVATRAAMPYGILALALVNLLPLVVVLCAVGANIYWLALVVKLPALLGLPGDSVWASRSAHATSGTLTQAIQPRRSAGA